MTEISKAFELAIQNSALKNFEATVRKSLANPLNLFSQNDPLFAENFPEVTAKNIKSFNPEDQTKLFASQINSVLDDIVGKDKYLVWVQTYNDNVEIFGHQKLVNALNKIPDEAFQTIVDKVVTEKLCLSGSPEWVFNTAQRIYEAILAQTLFDKALKDYKEKKEEPLDSFINNIIDESVNDAFLTFLDFATKYGNELFIKVFTRQFITELFTFYKSPKDTTYLNNIVKKVFSAVIRTK